MQISKEEREAAEIKAAVEVRIHRSACFQRLFGGKDGDFVLDEIDKLVNYKGNQFDPDPYIHAYNAGQRSMAVLIHNILDQDVELAKKILKEKKNG